MSKTMTVLVSLRRLGFPVAASVHQHVVLTYDDDGAAPMVGAELVVAHAGHTSTFRYLGVSRYGPEPRRQPFYICRACGQHHSFIQEPACTPCGTCGQARGWTLPLEFLFQPVN